MANNKFDCNYPNNAKIFSNDHDLNWLEHSRITKKNTILSARNAKKIYYPTCGNILPAEDFSTKLPTVQRTGLRKKTSQKNYKQTYSWNQQSYTNPNQELSATTEIWSTQLCKHSTDEKLSRNHQKIKHRNHWKG